MTESYDIVVVGAGKNIPSLSHRALCLTLFPHRLVRPRRCQSVSGDVPSREDGGLRER